MDQATEHLHGEGQIPSRESQHHTNQSSCLNQQLGLHSESRRFLPHADFLPIPVTLQ